MSICVFYHNLKNFFLISFIYLFERERAEEGRGSEGEADSLRSGEPNTGLDPETLGSWPEQKVDRYPTEPPRTLIGSPAGPFRTGWTR